MALYQRMKNFERKGAANKKIEVGNVRPYFILKGEHEAKQAFLPARFRPSLFKVERSEDIPTNLPPTVEINRKYYVMPIGTLVSDYSVANISGSTREYDAAPPAAWNNTGGDVKTLEDTGVNNITTTAIDDTLNILGIDESGEIHVGTNLHDGSALSVDARDSYYGYPRSLQGIFDICNGSGTPVYDKWTTLDVEAGFLDEDGNVITMGTAFDSADLVTQWDGVATDGPAWVADSSDGVNTDGDPIARPANMLPSGIVINDVLRDNRGQYYSYGNPTGQFSYTIMTHGKIAIPFVLDNLAVSQAVLAVNRTSGDTEAIIDEAGAGPGDLTVAGYGAGYDSIVDFPFMYIDMAAWRDVGPPVVPGNINDLNGNLRLKPDAMGKFTYWTEGTDSTLLRCGTIFKIDNKYPRAMDELIDVLPEQELFGTNTLGVPPVLYKFAKRVLEANWGATHIITRETILQAVSAGIFGYVQIMVNCQH